MGLCFQIVRPSVHLKPEIPSFHLYMGLLVHPTNGDRFVACQSVCPHFEPYLPHRFGSYSVTCFRRRKWRCFLGIHDTRVWGTIDCVLHLVVVIGLVCVPQIFLSLLMGCWYRGWQHCKLLKWMTMGWFGGGRIPLWILGWGKRRPGLKLLGNKHARHFLFISLLFLIVRRVWETSELILCVRSVSKVW